MLSQHAYQNCLVYLNSSRQTCQRFHRAAFKFIQNCFNFTSWVSSLKYSAGFKEAYALMRQWSFTLHLQQCQRNYISVLIWQQRYGESSLMREKKGGRCRRGGKERRGGRHAWESCGRCLKTLRADDEKRLSHSPTRFPGLPPLHFPSLSQWVCPHLPTHPLSSPPYPPPPASACGVQPEWRLGTAV